jgi:hypothetical protein
LDFQVNN